MSLEIVNEQARSQEQLVQESIFRTIDENRKIVFNAGAGAGKTFALIESLKYIISHYGKKLISNNQKIICITYTNTAVQEIRERLGNTNLVIVSTIHERLWDLIKDHQNELVKIHTENLQKKMDEKNYDLNENSEKTEYLAYRSLSEDLKESLKDYLYRVKDSYYKYSDKPAAQFKEFFKSDLDPYPNIINNVSKFKKMVGLIFRISNYKECIFKISEKHYKHCRVEYDSKYNNDILHKMIISHDTLIEYAHKIIDGNGILRKIIIDKYPYILIDEYQDTNQLVVKSIKLLCQYSEEKKLPLFLGYFGDPVQNIYDDGVGSKLSEIHPGLLSIDKKYNRRSHIEIIDVINRIRGGEILQESIFDDCEGGSIKFYKSRNRNEEIIKSFINKYKEQWHASIDNPVHCLVLTNKSVAEYTGFPEVFNKLSSTAFYKKRWEQIGTEILSHELDKLGKIPLIFYNILNFKSTIENPKTPISKFLKNSMYRNLSFNDLKKFFLFLNRLRQNTFKDYLKSIFELYADTNFSEPYKMIIIELLKFPELTEYTFDCFCNYLLNNLFPYIDNENVEEINDAKTHVQEILNVSMEQFMKWFHFINETQNTDVIYHTYHGTKGREYENVIIIMENNFGVRNIDKFSSFFLNFFNQDNLTDEHDIQKFNNTKNLLYVSCSRAIKNLRILYLDDTTPFSRSVDYIFGNNYLYPTEN